MENEKQRTIRIIKSMMEDTKDSIVRGEIAMTFEMSNPWKGGDVKEKAQRNIRIDKLKNTTKSNEEYLDFLERYLAKLEK
jgi:hypothetical protein